ncbi:DNA primase [Aquisalinus flavus]|uniref:DNA primase n=1 Tax=Aquisalinus flavus TaxID=1526572 RepID=A0A8J2Y735_9PROT|nr:DNA primase [Aquisalinus flavus]MBD0426143.1 DNA primase [Aquisalinus flavus]UNE48276.1 DNA primase [Aquisalinus flavus]GGD10278.1 DNA primase [Aquisalinus flavus]
MARFTPDFLDQLRDRLRASDVIGQHVKLKREGREFRGLSPFTNEKTPSFFVNDDKQRYFDFSSGKSGDVVGFLMDTQKLTFVEAVTRLAEQAGMDIPQDSYEDRQKEEERKGLAEACAAAAKFYMDSLQRIEGRNAREYLEGRQVPEKLQRSFGMGYAPAERTALKDHLINKGFDPKLLVEAGLLIQPDNGAPYDRFRDRVMFPILWQKNKVIAFGGRALDKSAKAKYLNSPETPLFHKGHVLYNYMRARKAAADLPKETGQPLIVCEGYMDVIALAGAGFENAVAPLGTALTESQIELLWRACDEPVLCFDGDRAGVGAAHRAIDRALPILRPGKSLRFAFLPEGQDPDDMVKTQGAQALRSVLDAAQPLADVLWTREIEAQPLTTPERKAAFRAHLRQLVKGIVDKDVRLAYGGYFSEKLGQMNAPPRQQGDGNRGFSGGYVPRGGNRPGFFGRGGMAPTVQASMALKARLGTAAGAAQGGRVASQREALLVITLLNHPGLFARQEEAILDLELADPDYSALLREIISSLSADPALDREGLALHMSTVAHIAGTMEQMLKNERLRLTKFACADATLDDAEDGWLNTLSIHLHHGPLRLEEMEAAGEAFLDETSEARWRVTHTHRQAVVADNKVQDER